MGKIASRFSVKDWAEKYGSDFFLLLLYGYLCVSIYSRAYLRGAYIEPDSSAYMRQALNLASGNGFSYDGLAGYHSWFAWWPIFYPVLIMLTMLTTGTEVYLASKILTMVIAGLILLIFRKCFGKNAWVYGLCLTNLGFLKIFYGTLSEIPFMLFLLCFGLVLAKILKEGNLGVTWYIALSITGLGCFLTRYFGAYVWIVTGLYILVLFMRFLKRKEKECFYKAIKLSVTAFISGCLCLAYLLMNKIMNGAATGMSRTLWWDDYRLLTNDLIESLLTEFFNIFSLQIPVLLDEFPFGLKALVVVGIITGVVWFVSKNGKHFSRESVLITMAVMYDIIFICIRYFSSMDTFSYRFFEPATFILCIGLIGLLLPYLKGKSLFHYFAGMSTILIVFSIGTIFINGGMDSSDNYYEALRQQWKDAYSEIPERSVIAFTGIDFGGSFYRPDVVVKDIPMENEFDELEYVYYGSDYLCIRIGDASHMIESGAYRESVVDILDMGLASRQEGDEFIVIPLKNNK